ERRRRVSHLAHRGGDRWSDLLAVARAAAAPRRLARGDSRAGRHPRPRDRFGVPAVARLRSVACGLPITESDSVGRQRGAYASGGRVAVRVDSVTLGGFGLPDSVRTSAAASVENAIGQLVPSTVTVQQVTLGEGTVTIEGVTGR